MCINCGYCIDNMLEYDNSIDTLGYKCEIMADINEESYDTQFEDILINNNIYNHKEISYEYGKLKKVLGRKVINAYIYGYATYTYLRSNGDIRSFEEVASIFNVNVKKFRKAHSKIILLMNVNEDENVFINDSYYYSLIFPFVKDFNLNLLAKNIVDLITSIKHNLDGVRPNIIAAGCIFYELKQKKMKLGGAADKIAKYFNCSTRSVSTIRNRIKKILC